MRSAIMRWILALSVSMLAMGALLATAAKAGPALSAIEEASAVWSSAGHPHVARLDPDQTGSAVLGRSRR